MRSAARLAIGMVLAAAIVLLVLNAGDHAWIASTPAYRALGSLVAVNTIVFAVIAGVKLGYRSGRAALMTHR